VPLSTLASELDMPLSATHRLLAELVRCGYVRQHQNHSDYMLTIKLVSLGQQPVRGAQRHVELGGQCRQRHALRTGGEVFEDFEAAFEDRAHRGGVVGFAGSGA
jgi:DNA-binding IclR family transcriptional regulator